ncbi:MAG: VOC family protein, partial [Acidimicrobiales bacterium]
MAELDHVVIHIDDWESCTTFYSTVLDAQVIENPEGAGNPLGSVVYRIGGQQINVHGPWPGMAERCCPEPFDRVGGTDLAFRVEIPPSATLARLKRLGVD